MTFDGVTYQAHEDWTAETEYVTVPRSTNLQGRVGESEEHVITRIRIKPVATSANLATLLAKLYPYQPGNIGQLIFPSVDKPGVIQTKDGKAVTFAAGAITDMPEMTLAPNVDLFGEFEVTFLRENETTGSDEDAHAEVTDNAYAEPTLDPLTLISCRYALGWGDTPPFNAIETTAAGIRFKPTASFAELKTQRDGLLNMRLTGVTAQARFEPVNLDVDDFINALMFDSGASAGRGKMIGTRGFPLAVTGEGAGNPMLTLPLAAPKTSRQQFANGETPRVGEVLMEAQRKYASGALQPLYAVAVVPPGDG